MRRHSAHVDANVLAELNAGLIGGRRATRISAHLAGCERCSRVGAGLSEVSMLLAAVPPQVMPDAVTSRLTAAIERAAAARAGEARSGAAEPQAGPTDQETIHHSERARRDSARPVRRAFPGLPGLRAPVAARAFAAAAAACVLAAGGYTVAQLTSHGLTASPSSPRRNGSGPVSGPIQSPKAGLGRPQPSSTPSGGGSVLEQFSIVRSGTDYQPAGLAAQIEHELSRAGGTREYAPTAAQYACVQGVTGGNHPTMVDMAEYKGHPATVIAMAAEGTHIPQAWIVGPTCSASNSDTLAHVMLATSGG